MCKAYSFVKSTCYIQLLTSRYKTTPPAFGSALTVEEYLGSGDVGCCVGVCCRSHPAERRPHKIQHEHQ